MNRDYPLSPTPDPKSINKKADSLMDKAYRKKSFARDQEMVAKAMKIAEKRKTKLIGWDQVSPTERLKRASDARKSATKDSSDAVQLRRKLK
jgi:hypothetical protein